MAIMNKDRQPHGFTVGQLVYMYNPSGGKLQTGVAEKYNVTL